MVIWIIGALVLAITLVLFIAYLSSKKSFPIKLKTKIPTKDVEKHASEILARMTTKEKFKQIVGEPFLRGLSKIFMTETKIRKMHHFYSGYNKRLDIPAFAFSDGPRGVVAGKNNTCFPVGMARGATFDTELEHRVGHAIGYEMRKNKANYFAGVTINLVRHPRWGRAQESYGEDPWLLGEMGKALVLGVQSHNVMACAKHFALNSIENSRFYLDIQVDDRTLHEVYLPHFKKVVQEADVASIMSAYNLVRGEHAAESKLLLNDILREDWGFKGFVTSDWIAALRDGVKGVKAGNDVEMCMAWRYGRKLKNAYKEGRITEEDLDKLVLRILQTKLLYSSKEDIFDYTFSIEKANEHKRLAKEVSEKSIVLLKNEGVLPIDASITKRIAVIGKNANQAILGDAGTSNIVPITSVVTPLQGIQKHLENTNVEVIYYDGGDVEKAASISSKCDFVVLVVGYDHEDEGEYFTLGLHGPSKKLQPGGDRLSIDLHKHDIGLIKAIGTSNTNNVVVYQGGSGIVTKEWDTYASSIVFFWYSGMEGGTGLANILFGKANPSGKLPFAVPKNEEDLPYFDSFVREIEYGYFHGYTYLDHTNVEPAYYFGHGLSYTNFEYSNLHVKTPSILEDETLEVLVNVKNTGDQAGEEVSFLFVGFDNSKVQRAKKLLRGFTRVSLQPGEEKTISFTINPKDLAWYNPQNQSWEVEPMTYQLFVGGHSNHKTLLRDQFELSKGGTK